jgi:hypothetical protein
MSAPLNSIKKPLERRDDFISDVVYPEKQTSGNFHALCGSLIERYTSEQLSIHLHLRTIEQTVRERSNLCIVIKGGDCAVKPQFPVKFDNVHVATSAEAQHCEQYPTVLVDVRKEIQSGEDGLFPALPKVVRLQTLDLCDRIGVDTLKPVALTHLIFEAFGGTANGEHVVFSGFVVRSAHKFPHQVIQTGPQVLNTISNNQPEAGGHGVLGFNTEYGVIRVALWISHHFARVRLEVPLKLGFKAFEMKLGPEDFLSDGI